MKLSKAQVKALEAVDEACHRGGGEMYRTYRNMHPTTKKKLINLVLIERVRLGPCLIGLTLTPAGRQALEEARNGK